MLAYLEALYLPTMSLDRCCWRLKVKYEGVVVEMELIRETRKAAWRHIVTRCGQANAEEIGAQLIGRSNSRLIPIINIEIKPMINGMACKYASSGNLQRKCRVAGQER